MSDVSRYVPTYLNTSSQATAVQIHGEDQIAKHDKGLLRRHSRTS